jgi:hypothetical protein
MDRFEFFVQKRKSYGVPGVAIKGLKPKEKLIQTIRHCLYLDPPFCTRVDPVAIRELRAVAQRNVNHGGITCAGTPAVAPPRPLQQQPQHNHHLPHRQPLFLPPHFGFHYHDQLQRDMSQNKAGTAAHLPTPATTAARVKQEPDLDDGSSAWGSLACSPATLSSSSSSSISVQVAGESILPELLAMGFTDRAEILATICRLTESAALVTAEAVMVDIISQREEAEEARKMDQARLLSEQARKADSKQRRQMIEEDLQNTRQSLSWNDWLERRDMFPDSWILRLSALRVALERLIQSDRAVKHNFVSLLMLEKKSFQWYGKVLPGAFFRNVLPERLLLPLDATTGVAGCLARTLDTQVKELEFHMYSLSEQQGGVPLLFRDALDANVGRRNSSSSSDEDDTVVVVKTRSPVSSSSMTSKGALLQGAIEIL